MADNISNISETANAVANVVNSSRDWHDTINEGLLVTATGIGVVFAVLIVMIIFINIFKKLDYMWEHRENSEKEERLLKEQNIDDLTLVLISSAVAAYTHNRAKIRRVRVLPSTAKQGGNWAMQARSVLQTSHSRNKK